MPSDNIETIDWIDIPYRAEKEHAGLRVDAFLKSRLKSRSRTEIQRIIDAGQVFLGKRHLKSATRLRSGETVTVRFPRRSDPPARYESLPILWEDEHLLAANKPGDLVSHPTDKIKLNSVTEVLRRQKPELSLHLVHRLDRETSGAILLAKNPNAARAMTKQFTARAVRKEYWALVSGRVLFKHKIVSAPLGFEGREIKVRRAVDPAGEAALTEFERLAVSQDLSLISARPKTGRLHQIRAHLAWLGHPVLGDKLYRGTGEAYLKAIRRELSESDLKALGAPRQMLHSRTIAFQHPVSKRWISLEAPLPPDFLEAMGPLTVPKDPY